jgi:putative SOS response-associated peptidase YedK
LTTLQPIDNLSRYVWSLRIPGRSLDRARVQPRAHEWKFPPGFNVAPTQDVPVVRVEDGERYGSRLHWGLIPFWAKGMQPKYSTINATVEKLTEGATWPMGPAIDCREDERLLLAYA